MATQPAAGGRSEGSWLGAAWLGSSAVAGWCRKSSEKMVTSDHAPSSGCTLFGRTWMEISQLCGQHTSLGETPGSGILREQKDVNQFLQLAFGTICFGWK